MKISAASLLLLSLSLFSSPYCTTAQTDNSISIGHVDTLFSEILHEQRKIWIHVPDGNSDKTFTPQRYPVVYLLDGDAHFQSVVGMIQQLSDRNGNDICPKMIVVGIPSMNRFRDLSPTKVESGPYLEKSATRITGGGEAFLAFMEKELMPHIEAKYPTEPYRMLIGHSLGGLLAVHSMVHHPKLFNSYIAIDPSMWWDERKLIAEAEKALSERRFEGTSLYVGIANTMDAGMDVEKVQSDTAKSSEHIRSILAFDRLLKNKPAGLKYGSKFYPDDTHNSSALITEYDALRFIFDFYPMKLKGSDMRDTTFALVRRIERAYALRSEKMGYPVKPPEETYNWLGYTALTRKHYALAENYFRLNLGYYPQSFNANDSYGDYFMKIGNKEKAILYFQKSLDLREVPEIREKMEELKKK